jgi:putative tryptophan/tyrosine transport system substrate-binding protein
LAWPLVAPAQTGKVARIGYLAPGSHDNPLVRQNLDAFRECVRGRSFPRGLAEACFADGKNITIDYRWGEGRYHALPALAAELVNRRLAVIAGRVLAETL